MGNIAQLTQGESPTSTYPNHRQTTYAGVWLTESLPLPGNRVESKQMPQHNCIGAGMGDDDHLLSGIVDVPEVTIALLHRMYSVGVEGGYETADHSFVERSECLTTRSDSFPQLI